jgi:transposase InsO family protein
MVSSGHSTNQQTRQKLSTGMRLATGDPRGTVIHTDQGTQFTSWAFTHRSPPVRTRRLDGLGGRLALTVLSPKRSEFACRPKP